MLDPEDLDTLFDLLKRTSKNWRDIGRHLGFLLTELDQITTTTGLSQNDHYLQHLLDLWLNRAPPLHQFPFTEDLAKALREVKSYRIAYDLEKSEDFMADRRLCAKKGTAPFTPPLLTVITTCTPSTTITTLTITPHLSHPSPHTYPTHHPTPIPPITPHLSHPSPHTYPTHHPTPIPPITPHLSHPSPHTYPTHHPTPIPPITPHLSHPSPHTYPTHHPTPIPPITPHLSHPSPHTYPTHHPTPIPPITPHLSHPSPHTYPTHHPTPITPRLSSFV